MYSKLESSKKEQRKAITLPPSVSETYVGLRAHLGEGIYLLENGDLGITFAVEGIYDEVLTENDLYAAFSPYAKFLGAVSKGIPPHKENASTVVQIICSQRVIEKAPALSGASAGAGAIIQHEIGSLFSSGLIRRNFYLTVRWTPEHKPLNLGRALTIFKQAVALSSENSIAAASELETQRSYFAKELKRALLESSLKAKVLEEQELIAYYNSVFHRGLAQPYKLKFEELEPAWTSIISPACQGTPHGFTYDNGNISIFTFSELPPVFALGRFRPEDF